jgi:hypothetical protein
VNNWTEIWPGDIAGSYVLIKNTQEKGRPAGFIELMREGSFYRVNSAFPAEMNYLKFNNRKPLWKRDLPVLTATGERNPFNALGEQTLYPYKARG